MPSQTPYRPYHYGKPSEAHSYDERWQCVYCGMYKSAVEQMTHVCTPEREALIQAQYDHKGVRPVETKPPVVPPKQATVVPSKLPVVPPKAVK